MLPVLTRFAAELLVWSLILGMGSQPVAAAEGEEARIDDVRIEWTPRYAQDTRASGHLEHQIPALGVNDHSTLSEDLSIYSHQRLAIGFFRSLEALDADRGSFLVGAQVTYDRLETRIGSEARSFLLEGFAGWAWGFTPSWHVEEGVILGGGQSHWDLLSRGGHFDGTDSRETSNGFIYDYGVRLGTTYTWQHLVVGIDLRYLITSTDQQFNDRYSANGIDETSRWHATIRCEGYGATGMLGYRF